jgi:aminoglycoside phosphotransferase (APT) family kinase protein
VLVDGPHGAVIDWSDAGLGDRHGDVARSVLLFELASVASSGRAERVALRAVGPRMAATYRRAYESSLPLDPQRLALWRPAHLVHGWAQVLGARSGRFDDDGSLAARLPDGLLADLQRRFADAIAAV